MDLYRGGSPVQIPVGHAAFTRTSRPNRVRHETMYPVFYALPQGELRKALLAQVWQGHKTRRLRSRCLDRRSGLKNMTSIHDLPVEMVGRAVTGWEGTGNRSAVSALVERTRRCIILAWMENTDAEVALKGLTRAMRPPAPDLRETLTYDQGKDMVRPEELYERLRITVYLADPRSPRRRPSNENANGLIRE